MEGVRKIWTRLGVARRRVRWRLPQLATAVHTMNAMLAAMADNMAHLKMKGECDWCCLRTWATAPVIGRRRRDGRVVAYDPRRHRFRVRRADGTKFWAAAAAPVTEARIACASTAVWEMARDGGATLLGRRRDWSQLRCPCQGPGRTGETRFWVPLGVSQTASMRGRGIWAPIAQGEGGATVQDGDV